MKKLLSLLLLFTALTAHEIKTPLASPFDVINLDLDWFLVDIDDNYLIYNNTTFDDTDLTLIQGEPLAKKITAKDLFEECQKAKGKFSRISSLKKSFPDIPSDLAFDTPSLTQVSGREAVKFLSYNTLDIETHSSTGKVEHYSVKLRGVHYLIPSGNQITVITVETPINLFSNVLAHIEETVLPQLLLKI